MLAEDNPYTPNAGAQPRYLAGREDELDSFRVLLRRMKKGYNDQSMIVVGLRGVGKTVLLSAFRNITEEEGDLVAVEAEITKHEDFGPRMGALLRRARSPVGQVESPRSACRVGASLISDHGDARGRSERKPARDRPPRRHR